MLEHVFGDLVLFQEIGVNLIELPYHGIIILFVEEVQATIETDLGDETGIGTGADVPVNHGLITFFLKAHGTKGLVAFSQDIPGLCRYPVEYGPGPLEHAVIIEVERVAETLRGTVLAMEEDPSKEDRGGKQRRFKCFVHNDILRKFIVQSYNPQIYS